MVPRVFQLNNGLSIPSVGLGAWMGQPVQDEQGNQATFNMISEALKVGYVHFDTAFGYGNESAVGQAIREAKASVDRSRLFVTTKLTEKDHGRVAEAFERSLKTLDIEYIDLYLMHWPLAKDPESGETIPFDSSPTFVETWKEMEKLLDTGKVKSIGVSNFSVKNLEILLPTVKVVPAVNQCEAHPYLPQDDLRAYCQSKGIHLTAYSPVGQADSPIIKEEVILDIAKAHNQSPGAVVLSWGVQRGWSVVPKSSNPERMRQNSDLFDLTESEMEQINLLGAKNQSLTAYQDKQNGYLFGWRLKEDFGWDYELTRP